MKFDDVCLADDAKLKRAEGEAASNAQPGTGLGAGGVVGLFVKLLTLHGQTVLRPLLLVVDQRTLPRAIDQVLQGTDGQEI